jgi:hypothetical protein
VTKHYTRRTRRATREERRARGAQWVVEEVDERTRASRVVSYHLTMSEATRALVAPEEVPQ